MIPKSYPSSSRSPVPRLAATIVSGAVAGPVRVSAHPATTPARSTGVPVWRGEA